MTGDLTARRGLAKECVPYTSVCSLDVVACTVDSSCDRQPYARETRVRWVRLQQVAL